MTREAITVRDLRALLDKADQDRRVYIFDADTGELHALTGLSTGKASHDKIEAFILGGCGYVDDDLATCLEGPLTPVWEMEGGG